MKKIYFTLMLAFMAVLSATAQTGNYTGTLDITAPTGNQQLTNQTIEIAASTQNYVVTMKSFTIEVFGTKIIDGEDITIDNVVINSGDGGYTFSSGTFPVTISLGTVDVKINSGSIVNNALSLDLTILVNGGQMQVGVVFTDNNNSTGIYSTAQDGAKAVAYYSITGKKLAEEPANGIFIVKYSNGKSLKVVK